MHPEVRHLGLFLAPSKEIQDRLMNPRYIFAGMSVTGSPPTINKEPNIINGYVFMPLGGKEVYTIDNEVWSAQGASAEIFLYPTKDEFSEFFNSLGDANRHVLIALIDHRSVDIPGRGLIDLEPMESIDNLSMLNVGFDVIDLFALSSVANIGYSIEEYEKIKDLGVHVNEYGLINDRASAIKFAEFADNSADEHSPFLVVNIISLIQPKTSSGL